MDWLFSFDLSHSWDWIIAQAPTTTPTASPTSNAIKNAVEIDSLKAQVEFLKLTNTQLGENFNRFMTAMQISLGVFTFLGVLLAYAIGKNLEDAKKTANEFVKQEIVDKVTTLVQSEVENVRRTLERERVIGSTTVDFYLPSDSSEPTDYKLLQSRGFKKVRFYNLKRKPKDPKADVVVLDLINCNIFPEDEFKNLSFDDATKKREAKVKSLIDDCLGWLDDTTVLVIYIKGRFTEIDKLANRVNYYYVSANTPVTLMGIVADSAYVAYGEKNN